MCVGGRGIERREKQGRRKKKRKGRFKHWRDIVVVAPLSREKESKAHTHFSSTCYSECLGTSSMSITQELVDVPNHGPHPRHSESDLYFNISPSDCVRIKV